MKEAYEVGYAKPPVNSRFKKGESGNPRGRKQGAKNKVRPIQEERLQSILLAEAYRSVKINDGNKQVSLSMAEAIIRSLAVNAAKGQPRSQKIFLDMLAHTEQSKKQFYIDALERMIEYKREGEYEIARCKNLGITPPEMFPHPDHIHINLRSGQVDIIGPLTPAEKPLWDRLRELKTNYENEIQELKQILINEPDCSYKKTVLDEIEWSKRILDKINTSLSTKVSLIQEF